MKTRLTDLWSEKDLQETMKLDITDQLLFTTGVVKYTTDFEPQITTKRTYKASEDQLASILAGKTPKESLKQRVEAVWDKGTSTTILNIIKGVSHINTTSISVDEDTKVIIMHSNIFTNMGNITYKLDGRVSKPFYNDIPIIVDDNCFLGTRSNPSIYTLYCLKENAILYNDYVDLTDPFISTDDEGTQILTTTKIIKLKVNDCDFIGESDYKDGPTDAELALDCNWEGVNNRVEMFMVKI